MKRTAPWKSWLAAVLIALPGVAQADDPCADYVPQPKPQNASRDIVGQDLDRIRAQGHMLFAVYEDNPPYSWQDAGRARGVDVEIARRIAADLGVKARFNFVAAGENLQADLRYNIWKGPLVGGRIANVMMRVPYDSAFKCRVEQVVFTGQYAVERLAIAYREDAYPEDKPVPAYFRFDTVAVENDSMADFYLTQLVGPARIRRYPDMEAAMQALAAGETMAAMGPRAQLEFGAGEGVAVHQPPMPGIARGTWTLGVGVNFRYRPLGYAVDDAIRAALNDGTIAAIHAEYGLSHETPAYR